MRIFFLVLFLIGPVALFPDETIVSKEVVTLRCLRLKEKRAEKLELKNNLQNLINKNEKLTQVAGEKRVIVREKLAKNMTMLRRELVLVKMKIQKLEEEIIRKGCPPLDL